MYNILDHIIQHDSSKKSSLEELTTAVLLGAIEDILTYISYPSYQELLILYKPLSRKDRRSKMKEYWRAKRRSEKAIGWLDKDAEPKKNSKVYYISFKEACGNLNLNVNNTREKIRELLKQTLGNKSTQ